MTATCGDDQETTERCGSCRTGCGSLFGGTLHLGLGSSVGCYCLQNGSLSMTRTTLGQIQIQIQIQIESLHTRLDEIDEMTSAGGLPAGPFLSMCTMREPRAMLAASHSP